VTLRGRLTGAFLAVVLGPVLVGAVFVGGTVAEVNRHRSVERLDLAASAVRTSIGALCRQLRSAAETAAVLVAAGEPAEAASRRVVDQGLASAVRFADPSGTTTFLTSGAPAGPWADCSGAAGATDGSASAGYRAIAARVDLRDAAGNGLGHVWAARTLDLVVLRRLADSAGASVTLLAGADVTNAPVAPVLTTETGEAAVGVAAAAARTGPGDVTRTRDGRYVRRESPAPDQPLPLALSIAAPRPGGLYAVLVALVAGAALLAVAVAWWLARSTTRPLAEVAAAVDRAAGGDLDARVPVHRWDEVGRLAAAFNRMAHETQRYVQALTASRDQLRGHLGVLGDTLSSTHDLGRILQVLLRTALNATGARAGLVLLVDPAEGVLVGQCGEGLAGRLPAGQDVTAIRVPIGDGLLGGVAASREARRGRVDRDGPVLSTAEPRCVTYVAVPFAAASRSALASGAGTPGDEVTGAAGTVDPLPPGAPPAFGVLALYDRLGDDEFDDADLDTLRTFAGQAAVAVDNVRMHEEAQRLSMTDPLTGLLNYRSLTESLRREVERASRFGHTLGVLALDLDRFKTVNDSYGHLAGDAVLAECARRIRGAVREVDLTFRRSGEEFVVLLPETDAAGAAVVAERLRRAVRSTPVLVTTGLRRPQAAVPADIPVSVTVSIGIAVYPDHGDTGPRVLAAADSALYAAKAAGRDGYRLVAVAEAPHPPPRAPAPEAGAPGTGGTGGVANRRQPPRQSRGG